MPLPYQDYTPQMEALYDNVRKGPDRLALYGPPGVGLHTFIARFLEKYEDSLRREHIYCCSVACLRRNVKVKDFFTSIVLELVHILESASASNLFPQSTAELSRKYQAIESMTGQTDSFSVVRRFRDAVKDFFKCFGESFGGKIGVRLFITGFDSARKLFANVDETYPELLLEIYDKNSGWFGLTVASHRTIDVISAMFDHSTSYPARFRSLNFEIPDDSNPGDNNEPAAPISHVFLGGFSSEQMRDFYRFTSELLHEPLAFESKEEILYHCGTNPSRLSIFYQSLTQIAKVGGTFSQGERIECAFNNCKNQLDAQLKSFVDCMEDVAPNGAGVKTFEKAVNNPFSLEPNPVRKALIDMGILCYERREDEFGDSQEMIVPYIRALRDYLSPETERKPNSVGKKYAPVPQLCAVRDNVPLHVLHLSDLHFNSCASESEQEARTAYLRKFFEKLKSIQAKTPVDYVCFSGDIGMSGGCADDYQQAEEQILNILKTLKLKPDRFLPCPGNHDQNLAHLFEFAYPKTAQAANEYLNFDQFEYISDNFQNYSSLCEKLSCEPYVIGSRHCYNSYLTGVRDCGDFVAVCLNTAWFSMRDKENHALPSWVGANFVDAIGNQLSALPRKRVLTLMHHPVRCWAEEEQSFRPESSNTWNKVTDFSDFILCGHTHETDALSQTVNGRAKILSGACLYEGSRYFNGFCSYFFSGERMRTIRYSYNYQNGKWSQVVEDDPSDDSCAQ